ncbi:MAG: GIY-YIG nuclease family protein [Candidatus Electrothrix sp. GW3-4]|uniref:GIY-YIG nuclease family protein n=1 Tax=Candidatus Electrothrix sp. GW3-4 TaxID=3126740 RepID=UPI0030D0E39F
MNLEIKWHQPASLEDGDDENLIYSVDGLEEWEDLPAIYMFCRNYGGVLVPLYIGRSKNVGQRIKQHLNTTRMMKSIQKAPKGEKVLVIGEFIPKPGQSIDSSLKILEKTLIEHALTEGYELINKSGTKTPVHTISLSGYKAAKDFSGPKMYAKSKR